MRCFLVLLFIALGASVPLYAGKATITGTGRVAPNHDHI
jgi:hypothetical protein